jgi:hypothetical protein
MSNKMQNTDEFLDDVFDGLAVGGNVGNIVNPRPGILGTERAKQAISERIAAERLEAVSGLSTTKLIVDLSLAQVEILKLKANDHDWSVYVPDDTKLALEKTLASIEDQLAALTPQVSEGEKT